jgi:hypothetical protein
MAIYFFRASDGTRTVEDAEGSHFADDAMAMREIMATAKDALGREPMTLFVKDDTGRVLTPQT